MLLHSLKRLCSSGASTTSRSSRAKTIGKSRMCTDGTTVIWSPRSRSASGRPPKKTHSNWSIVSRTTLTKNARSPWWTMTCPCQPMRSLRRGARAGGLSQSCGSSPFGNTRTCVMPISASSSRSGSVETVTRSASAIACSIESVTSGRIAGWDGCPGGRSHSRSSMSCTSRTPASRICLRDSAESVALRWTTNVEPRPIVNSGTV